MLAALLEWFLWVAAFLYCIVKVFQKAESMSVRVLSVFFGFLFFCLR
jgi:chitin synthase